MCSTTVMSSIRARRASLPPIRPASNRSPAPAPRNGRRNSVGLRRSLHVLVRRRIEDVDADFQSNKLGVLPAIGPRHWSGRLMPRDGRRCQVASLGLRPYFAHILLTSAASLPPAMRPTTAEETLPPTTLASTM